MKTTFLLFSILLSIQTPAQELLGCPKMSPDDKCGQCDPILKKEVMGIVEGLDKGDITTVEDFLGILPNDMKSDFVMMSESRSFQTSDTLNPRVLLRSPNSDVVMSFNSHHDQAEKRDYRGSDRIELMVWNGKTARFDFIDIRFPADERGGLKGTKPIVTKNPQSCLNCHGGENPRPNWDPYNFWAGQIPFNRDTLVNGSQETKDYIELLRRIEGKSSVPNPRLQKLKGLISSSDIDNALKIQGSFMLPTLSSTASNNSDGPGVKLFDQLSQKNFCRIGHSLNDHQDKDKFKYALQAMMRFCPVAENIRNFIPPALTKQYEDFFIKRKMGLDSNNKFSMASLRDQTLDRQQSVFQDKAARQLWAFEKEYELRAEELKPIMGNLTPREFAMKEMDAMSPTRPLENRESTSNAKQIANLRFLLEPLGVNMDSWSMSIDPGTYSFADVMGSLTQYGVFADPDLANLSCEDLQEKSLEVFNQSLPDISDKIKSKTCRDNFSLEPLSDDSIVLVTKPITEMLRKNVSDLLTKNGCIACHDNGVNGAPKIDYSDLPKLEDYVRKTSKDSNGGFGQAIWNRINRPEGSSGQMPMGMPALSKEEQGLIKTYLNYVMKSGDSK